MARSHRRTCDNDACPADDVATYMMSGPHKTYEIDLCPVHAAPLLEIAQMGRVIGVPQQKEADVMDGLWKERNK